MQQRLFSLIDFLFSFNGRIGRLAYWAYNFGVIAVLVFFFVVLDGVDSMLDTPTATVLEDEETVLMAILLLILVAGYLWSTYAVTAKRWHDRDKSGWWSLIGFIPYVGSIWILVECGFLRGTDGANQYGDAPGSREGNLVEVFE